MPGLVLGALLSLVITTLLFTLEIFFTLCRCTAGLIARMLKK